jgi:hypothetical protein
MGSQSINSMEKKIEKLRQELAGLGSVMRGSIVKLGKKKKQYYFSLNKDKKTRLIYLGDAKVDSARKYTENYKKLLQIVEEMTILNMEMIRTDVRSNR